jgi:hypothetical protein
VSSNKDASRVQLDRWFESHGAACLFMETKLREDLVMSVGLLILVEELSKGDNPLLSLPETNGVNHIQ